MVYSNVSVTVRRSLRPVLRGLPEEPHSKRLELLKSVERAAISPAMPQQPQARRKQKARRAKHLAAWRERQEQAQQDTQKSAPKPKPKTTPKDKG
jgi:hypothetical protein